MSRTRTFSLLATAAVTVLALTITAGPATAAKPPKIGHVFVIMLENESFDSTFGPTSKAPYLSKTLPAKGAFVPNYFGITHVSQGNYTAMISGQGPTPQIQADCPQYLDFVQTGTGADGQALGTGCVYPKSVKTLAGQLTAKKLTWGGYMEDMGNNPAREPATCGHPALGAADPTLRASVGDQYATRHNPFVYFHEITDTKACAANDVPLPRLVKDLRSVKTTRNFSMITPNLCNDGHDEPCVDGKPGGLVSADAFLKTWVPRITSSPAFKKDGLLVITFDEAEAGGAEADSSACCNPPTYPNVANNALVTPGPGGGKIGAVMLSRFIKPGTKSTKSYNHFSFLASVEQNFGLKKLGYAARPGLATFGKDILNKK